MRTIIAALLLLLAAILAWLLFLATPAAAWEVDVREYYLMSSTEWAWGKPVSQRAYRYSEVAAKDVRAWVTEGAVEHQVAGVIGRVTLGAGALTDGSLQHRSANSLGLRSYSEVGGQVFYGQVEGGYRFIETPRFQLDGLVGLRYSYEIIEGQGVAGSPLGTLAPNNDPHGAGERAATEQTEWLAPTLKVRARYRLLDNLAVFGHVGGSPWMWMGFEETRPIRSNGTHYDLRHKATSGEATGGWALDALVGLEYRLNGYVSIKAGLAYALMQSGTGRFRYNPAVPDCRQPRCQPVPFDFQARHQSWGPFAGVTIKW
jgi:hypothetical protein